MDDSEKLDLSLLKGAETLRSTDDGFAIDLPREAVEVAEFQEGDRIMVAIDEDAEPKSIALSKWELESDVLDAGE